MVYNVDDQLVVKISKNIVKTTKTGFLKVIFFDQMQKRDRKGEEESLKWGGGPKIFFKVWYFSKFGSKKNLFLIFLIYGPKHLFELGKMSYLNTGGAVEHG